ncbi:MAG: hypothetical protein HY063_00970 [Bacteroidetes bacterium]|nr:hypothetical protein [Bacteroidota bacterium]
MKTKKLWLCILRRSPMGLLRESFGPTKSGFLTAILALGLFAISAGKAVKPVTKKVSAGNASEMKQCGVTSAQIISYLVNCSHHHTSACCVVDIPGTCNSNASIENCGTATVYVTDGIIVGHIDVAGVCPG